MRNEQFLLLVGDVLNRKADRRYWHVDDQVDLVDVVPAPRDAAADVGLELMIADDDADRLAEHLAASIAAASAPSMDRVLTNIIFPPPLAHWPLLRVSSAR